jgi:hypothetical protein
LIKNEEELYKILLNAPGEPEDYTSREHKLAFTAVRHNIGNYLARYIDCKWGSQINTDCDDFMLNFLDDANILKTILRSSVVEVVKNYTLSKNGYKMFYKLYRRLKKIMHPDIRNFLIPEFPEYGRKLHEEWEKGFMKTKFGRHKVSMNSRNRLYLLYTIIPYRVIKLISKMLGKK